MTRAEAAAFGVFGLALVGLVGTGVALHTTDEEPTSEPTSEYQPEVTPAPEQPDWPTTAEVEQGISIGYDGATVTCYEQDPSMYSQFSCGVSKPGYQPAIVWVTIDPDGQFTWRQTSP